MQVHEAIGTLDDVEKGADLVRRGRLPIPDRERNEVDAEVVQQLDWYVEVVLCAEVGGDVRL